MKIKKIKFIIRIDSCLLKDLISRLIVVVNKKELNEIKILIINVLKIYNDINNNNILN